MRNKGFYLSLEAAISLSIMIFLSLSVLPYYLPQNTEELSTIKKMHDLLKVWQSLPEISNETLINDTNFVFPEQDFAIYVDGSEIFNTTEIGIDTMQKHVVSGKVYSKTGNETEIALIVFN